MLRAFATVVCAAALAGACGGDSPPDTTPHSYDADDPNIQYMGRVDTTNPKLARFSLGATTIRARFVGTGAAVLLKDEHRFSWRNYYDAIVDDVPVMTIRPDDDTSITRYQVISDLPVGEHEIRIVRRTEPNVGNGFFQGFEFAGTIAPPGDLPTRKMEFIGDSITAGSGIEAPNNDAACASDGWGQPVMNADLAYGPVLARELNAQYHVIGVSGIGLTRNYESNPAEGDTRPMPEVYDLLLPQLPAGANNAWTPSRYVPNVVVVALGTNDFSPGDMPPGERPKIAVADFVTAYAAFVTKLRGYYPNADIFAISSPMLGDGWPMAADTYATDLKNAVTMVEDQFAAAGDTKVHSFHVTKQSGAGCGTHPDVDQQADTALELGAYVATIMGW
jgi:lysophospholipase L1-like esterase